MNTRKEFSLMTGDQRPVVYENSFSEEDNKEFMAALPQVVHDLSTATPLAKVPQCAERIADCLYYTARCGGNTRPLIFLYSYKKLERRENLTPENLRLACILAWCVKVMMLTPYAVACLEILPGGGLAIRGYRIIQDMSCTLETHTVIFDDIVDESRYRYRGVCWHLRKDIGLSAIYDGELIEKVVYALLKKHFSSHPQYHNIVEFLQDTMLEIAIGQQLDSTNPGVDHLTMELFNHIVLRKGGHLFHYLPVVTAMRLANVDDPEIYQRAIPILLKMGSIFQMQDDYLDCYGDEIKLGKDFTDMRNGKTTWLVVTALEKIQRQPAPAAAGVLRESERRGDQNN
ncbi:hypothetical protein NQ318_003960 [Aromia moschata]|uniref:Farnesyl pyrophosphate synthase n=1 Tax=Aromia moschata TaxID=1265417 RepID=A0AAV8Z7Q5_9CUCU|nr:hypothetical protein NQ318_003960 [Aromia moschata]